ncbi:PBS lyase HEAT-like repeat domain protein [Synechococcus sp. PCC 7335]|uniref:HEAT repeat domain-containing protein n=1 Tax=Synechococcus sp. (strain ATCC 29403 / PCC 7335) TaxID=91464 RepID=UPI00017EDC5C|nr:HEAT repeat domain-containing protein [Synechococcus sp. PCC 7335]EDX85845.1 PBS lyase HEAT-like repeat domain protein [Synechococcus sp. PCC 7335]
MTSPGQPALSHAEADALIVEVQTQQNTGTFDATDVQLIEQLVEGFNDTRGMKRLAFAEILGKVGKPATPALINGLRQHENPTVRRACAKTMTLIADPSTIPTLVHSLLHDDDTVVRGSAVGALAVMGEAAAPVLLDIIASPAYPDSSKGLATWGLSFIGRAGAQHLYQAIDSDQAEVRSAVVGALTSLAQDNDDQEALGLIISSLSDRSAMVRSEAAAALGKLSNPDMVSYLTTALPDRDSDVRKTVAMALMKIGDSQAIAPLKTALENETDEALQPVFRLAISQLERKVEADDWD